MQKGYGPEVDWWSIGVILFEMLIGYPPFFSESASDTCKKILNWRNNLSFPDKTKISEEAYDIIKRLITDVDKRLGYNGSEDIKKHPFFRGINWDNILKSQPPFIPNVNFSNNFLFFYYRFLQKLIQNILRILRKLNPFTLRLKKIVNGLIR